MSPPSQQSSLTSTTPAQLTTTLQHLGVRYLRSPAAAPQAENIAPADLLAGLAASPEARLRLALIPLLLWRPDLAVDAAQVEPYLVARPRLFLQCYYTAALLLQRINTDRLVPLGAGRETLPDLFSSRLDLSLTGDAHQDLWRLAHRQAQLSAEQANWLGTYYHAARTFIERLEREAQWIR